MSRSGLARVRDRLAAARVLQHRGLVDLRRPDEAVRAFLAIRRHGAFGGLLSHAAALQGDAPAITDDRGTVSFRELDEMSDAWHAAWWSREFGPARLSRHFIATAAMSW